MLERTRPSRERGWQRERERGERGEGGRERVRVCLFVVINVVKRRSRHVVANDGYIVTNVAKRRSRHIVANDGYIWVVFDTG